MVYVPLDARLTDPVNYLALGSGPVTNGELAESYDSCRAAVKAANGKLGHISWLQKR